MRFFLRPYVGQWLTFCFLTICCSICVATETPMLIKYIKYEEVLDARQAYKHDLIKLILEQTKTEYGDYRIERYAINDPGYRRKALLMSQGEHINLLWTSPSSVMAKANVITIPIDILRGLLGYRICLINRTGTATFQDIMDVNALHRIRIGQGFSWPDFGIYTFNNITPVSAPTLDGLLGMLASNRFDCLPLGAIEIDEIYQEKLAQMPMLAIETSLLIYYDFPVYFFVSNKYPLLAERVKKGLQKLQDNGEFTKLFNRYYHHKLDALNIPNRRVICLKSPYMSSADQCQHPEQINVKYNNALRNQ